MKIDQIGFTWREKLYTEIHLDFINISSVFTFHNFWNNIWIAVHRSDKFFNNDSWWKHQLSSDELLSYFKWWWEKILYNSLCITLEPQQSLIKSLL